MKILITGGSGFIGSHTCVELIEAGYELVVVDNLCNSSIKAIQDVEKITRKRKFNRLNSITDKIWNFANSWPTLPVQ